MKLSDIKVDAAAVEAGRWVDNIPEMGDLRLKVRGIPNAAYRRLTDTLLRAIPRNKRIGGAIDPDERDRVTAECLVETVLLDWDGISDDDGKPLPYSRETARRLLTDPAFSRFNTAVVWAASIVGEQEAEQEDEEEKNS